MLDRPCSNVQCKAAGYPLHSHLSPSLPLPCVTVCHQVPSALYITTHNTHNRQTSIHSVGFEPQISAGDRPQTCATDRAANRTGYIWPYKEELKRNSRKLQIKLLHNLYCSPDYLFWHGAKVPGFIITFRHTTFGRTSLDESSAQHRDLYLTIRNNHKGQAFIPRRDSLLQSW